MSYLRLMRARVAGFFGGVRTNDDREELESHLEMATAEHVRRGMLPADARRKAMIESGGLAQAAEAIRGQRGLPWLESIGVDVRYALRALRHSPAFTTVVVATLALGIGANTAIFSVVRGVLLKPLPHREGDRLVYLRQSMDGPGGESINFSVPEIEDLKKGATALGGIAQFSAWWLTLLSHGEPSRMEVGLVSGNYFDVLGLKAVIGRLTDASNDGAGVAPVMVLTHDYWISHFGGDSSVVGRQVIVDGSPVTVIGVLQEAPLFPIRVDALLNMVISSHHVSATMVQGRTHRMTEVIARLAPGATVEQARSEVSSVYAREQADYKEAYDPGSHFRVAVIPFKKAIDEKARLTLIMLMAAAAFVMIISASNVLNLTLMRDGGREQELVVRAALGSGVARLRRLLLVENLLLALTGAALGAIIAVGGVKLLTLLAARYSPRANEIRLDGAVLAFTLTLSIVLALVLSFVAALPREGSFAAAIVSGARRMSGSAGRQRLQRALVITQVGVTVVLLAAAGLLTRTMIRLSDVRTGLESEEVLSVNVPLVTPAQMVTGSGDADAKERYERMEREVRALPGVVDVGVGSPGPLRGSDIVLEVKALERPLATGEAMPRADYRTANPSYFSAAGIPLIAGREFSTTDLPGSANVVIINKTLADRLYPHADAIGKQIAWTGDVLRFTPFHGDWRTIVGVVGNTQDGGQDVPFRAVVWMPFAQERVTGGGLVIRADRNVDQMKLAVEKIVHAIAPTAVVGKVVTVAQIKDESVAPRRLNAVLLSSLGILAVLIAAVGIAGILAFSVSARVNEIGIRMSLGADRGRVQRMILREGGTMLGIGLALGIVVAYFLLDVMRGLLFGVMPHDPLTLLAVSAFMAVVGLLACWIPALRASRVDPAITMRST
ncbi:MAG: ABC transporter permease [Gemmatimonadaceae bacterium]|nr:ABC transporter permease [Gemmatimonadaceae bacterium]